MKLIPGLIEERLKRCDLSEREAARQIGVSPVTVNRLRNGESSDVDTLIKLCNWLGVSPRTILDGQTEGDNVVATVASIIDANPELEKLLEGAIKDGIDYEVLENVIEYALWRFQKR